MCVQTSGLSFAQNTTGLRLGSRWMISPDKLDKLNTILKSPRPFRLSPKHKGCVCACQLRNERLAKRAQRLRSPISIVQTSQITTYQMVRIQFVPAATCRRSSQSVRCSWFVLAHILKNFDTLVYLKDTKHRRWRKLLSAQKEHRRTLWDIFRRTKQGLWLSQRNRAH